MERRLVTILFCDVRGSTALGERLDPEDVMEIMRGAFEVRISPICQCEGTLARPRATVPGPCWTGGRIPASIRFSFACRRFFIMFPEGDRPVQPTMLHERSGQLVEELDQFAALGGRQTD